MDYQKFIEQLSSLYEDWGEDSIRPKSERFQHALDQVEGMTTPNVMQLLNFAVKCMEPDEIYCEIGTYQGSTLIGALLDHPNRQAYAVDNFSEFDDAGESLDQLQNNLKNFNLQERVSFYNQDFEDFLLNFRENTSKKPIGVYCYDGASDYRSQVLGLLLARPFLAKKAIIVVNNGNWKTVQQANWDFVAANSECQLLLELLTPAARYPTFGNGIQVLSWDTARTYNYPASLFRDKRQQPVVKAISNLQP